jgi:hypothetical protein
MSSTPVFADALSRLHADIAIVRLVRAGIPATQISAVFPRLRAPNSVCCWLKNFNARISRPSKWPVAAAGLLGKLFQQSVRSAEFERELESLGLSADVAERILERIQDGSIVLCVHARTEMEASIAWHIFQHVAAENITCPDADFVHAPRELPVILPQLTGIAA